MLRRNRRKRLTGWVAGLAVVIGTAAVAVAVRSPSAQALTLGGSALIRSYPTGLCLDSDDQGVVRSGECNFGPSQDWQEAPSLRLEGLGLEGARPFANEFRLVNSETQRCLESNPAGDVFTQPCRQQYEYQTWIHVIPAMEPGRVPPGEDAWPAIYTNMATDMCLVTGGDGNPPRTVGCTGGDWADSMYFRRGY